MAMVDLRNSSLYIKDGSTNSIRVQIGEGNLNYTEARNIEIVKSRGRLDTTREGDDEAIDVSFAFIWEFITGDAEITIEDALRQRNHAVSWVSASTDTEAPYSVNLQIVKSGGCGTGNTGEQILLPIFNFTQLAHSLKDGTVDCKGKCLAVVSTPVRTP